MIHPSYTDLMAVVNSEVEPGEQPVVNSRYSIVLATAKRARQIIAGDEPLVKAHTLHLSVIHLISFQYLLTNKEQKAVALLV